MKIRMKRLAAVLCAVLMTAGLCVNVYAASVTASAAQSAALRDAKLAKTAVRGLETERDGREYEVEFVKKATGDRYEYTIDSRTGRIKEAEIEYAHKRNTSSKKISKAAAAGYVVKFSGFKKAVVNTGKCIYKKDGGEWVWKVTFRNGRCDYEYKVLAPTGKVIEYSREYR